jgi:hypothetical protein
MWSRPLNRNKQRPPPARRPRITDAQPPVGPRSFASLSCSHAIATGAQPGCASSQAAPEGRVRRLPETGEAGGRATAEPARNPQVHSRHNFRRNCRQDGPADRQGNSPGPPEVLYQGGGCRMGPGSPQRSAPHREHKTTFAPQHQPQRGAGFGQKHRRHRRFQH